MARSSRHRSHRPDRRSSRDRRERSGSEDSVQEQEGSSRGRRHRDEGAARSTKDSESERRKSTPGRLEGEKEGPVSLSSGDSSGERGKKRKERPGDASDAPAPATSNRWKADADTDADASATVLEEKDMKAKEIADAEKSVKQKVPSSESKSKPSKRHDGSHADRSRDSEARGESPRRRSEKESSRRGSGSQQADVKESERTRGLSRDTERRAATDKDSSREVSRDRGREHVKDKDRSSGRERNAGAAEVERDNLPEKGKAAEKEERPRRDKEHTSNNETRQHSDRGKSYDDKREESNGLTSKPSKTGNTEVGDKAKKHAEGDHIRPKDLGNTDGKVRNKSYGSDLDKEPNKQGKRDGPGDKERWQEDEMDNVDRSPTHAMSPLVNGIHHDRESDDKRHRDKSREDVGKEKRPSDGKHPVRPSRDHSSDKFENKHYKDVSQSKERNRLQDNDLEDRSGAKEYSDKYIDSREKKKLSVEKDINAPDYQSVDYNDDRSKEGSVRSSRVDSARLIQRRSSPSSAIDILHDRHNRRHTETLPTTISKDRQHTSSCSSGDKAYDHHSVESGSRQKEKAQSTGYSAKESPASQHNITPKSTNYSAAPRSSEKSASSGDRDNFRRKGAKRSLDVAEIGHRGSYLSDDREHSASGERKHESSSLKQIPDGNNKISLSGADTPRSSSSFYNRFDPISHGSSGLPPASARQGLGSPSAKSYVEDDSRVQSNDRRSNIRYKKIGDSHLGRGQGGAWNGGVPSWPPFANGFMPFQHGPGIQPVGQPFPSPSVFGARPFMDFNLSGVPFHIHEGPDRFSSHGRPLGWCNPSDGPYPSRSQGWEGNNGILGTETSIYGRPDLDQVKTVTGNGGWVMDGNKQKGPGIELMLARKEHASVYAREDNPRSENIDGQAHNKPDPNKGVTQSVDTRAKEDAESPQKAPKSLNSSTNSGVTSDRKYLSKLDISHDLAQPELYRHFINLLGNECQTHGSNVNFKTQGSVESFKMAVWSCNQVNRPVFPLVADVLFKKALSLYNKNLGKSEEEKPVIEDAPNAGASTSTEKDFSETVALETEQLVSRCSGMTLKPVKKEPSETADAEYAASAETERDEIAERQSEPNASSCVKMEHGNYDVAATSDGVGKEVGTAFRDDPTARCESLILGCLSRIPNSSESTH